jgi:NADH dehydrogenase [ubiquinone] 1 alpha subcomplex assembly factor 6
VRRHEVVEPLAAAIRRYRLPLTPFQHLIDAREQDLAAEPPADLAKLEAYAEATSSALVGLALSVLGSEGPAAAAAARGVGIAYALVGLIRAVPYHARAKRLFLPHSLLEEYQVNLQELFELHPSANLAGLVRHLAGAAAGHLAAARRQRQVVPRRALPALLPAVIADLYLRRLRRRNYDVFNPAVAQPAPLAAWRMGWYAWRGRF